MEELPLPSDLAHLVRQYARERHPCCDELTKVVWSQYSDRLIVLDPSDCGYLQYDPNMFRPMLDWQGPHKYPSCAKSSWWWKLYRMCKGVVQAYYRARYGWHYDMFTHRHQREHIISSLLRLRNPRLYSQDKILWKKFRYRKT